MNNNQTLCRYCFSIIIEDNKKKKEICNETFSCGEKIVIENALERIIDNLRKT